MGIHPVHAMKIRRRKVVNSKCLEQQGKTPTKTRSSYSLDSSSTSMPFGRISSRLVLENRCGGEAEREAEDIEGGRKGRYVTISWKRAEWLCSITYLKVGQLLSACSLRLERMNPAFCAFWVLSSAAKWLYISPLWAVLRPGHITYWSTRPLIAAPTRLSASVQNRLSKLNNAA